MSGDRLVVFDVETGGLDPFRHPVIQFAGVAVDQDWRELEALELKVDFDLDGADPEALRLNGYSAEVWAKESMSPPMARGRIADFLRRNATLEKVSQRSGRPYTVARLCGHNSRFDGEFLATWFKRAEQFLPGACFESLDTLALARWVSFVTPPGPRDHKLGSICEWLGIVHGGEHEALADVRATVAVAHRLTSALVPVALMGRQAS